MFKLSSISDKFQSVHKRDFFLLPLIMFFGFAIDGLYGMGHFLSFGIASICAVQFVSPNKISKSRKLNFFLGILVMTLFLWHGTIKYSIWKGLENHEKHNYKVAIYHLNRVVTIYPKSIGRFHVLLGQMYLENGDMEKARDHALKAQNINPDHEAPEELLMDIKTMKEKYLE